ncbi:hypothetical protein [Ideonella livida]|uniref:Uncharacterized protein n=1 Tax=Ideonella livida TaxID=2707176 RepID=A0A7C9PFM7_9BURK|nr:hypothetical protein [Ideonella livida]NDY90655.1 hypothetical protein [Ideonella livida]
MPTLWPAPWLAFWLMVSLGTLPACSLPLAPLPSRPAWIDAPGEGVSASAGLHVMGRAAQEALAITRARDELAKRLGVRLSSVQQTQETVIGERHSSVSQREVREEVEGQTVRSRVQAKWLDPHGTLWVWVVPIP